MSEFPCHIRLGNIPMDCDRRKLYGIFSKYGKVKKLYISPENDFGKVLMEDPSLTEKTYIDVLKTHSYLNLQYVVSKAHSHSNSFNDASGSITSNEDNGNIDACVTKNLVDVYGRIVTTLTDNDGNVYIPLYELKKSGFELFELGSLPARDGSRIYNQQKLQQFETFMRTKANEFITRFNCNISPNEINNTIEMEKRDFFNVSDHGMSGSNRRSFDNNKTDFNKSRGFKSPRSDYGNDTVHLNKSETVNDNSHEVPRNRSSLPSMRNRSFENPTFVIKQEMNNKPQLNVESKSNVKPVDRPITLNENKQVLESTCVQKSNSATSKSEGSCKPTTSDISIHASSNGEIVSPLRKPHSLKSIPQEIDQLKKKRKLVIEKVCDSGVFQFCEKIDDNTFTGFALPEGYNAEFEIINDIGSNCVHDAKFTPNVGDIVAVDHEDDIARGLILNVTQGQYMCALIDYGTTGKKREVRQLPEKYTLIPEFSFECEADVGIIQKLQQADNVKINIKTPCKITLSLESGEKYELTGKPIQSSLTDSSLATSLTVPIESKKVQEHVKEEAPSTVLTPKHDTESNENRANVAPLRKPHSLKSIPQEIDQLKKKRKLVIEKVCDSGVFQFCEKIDDKTFTGFALPEGYNGEFEMINDIGSNCVHDAKFTPNVGDIVAVDHEDDIARGLILSVTQGQYTCALIDYGTTGKKREVRQLPEKYSLIPEFSFECEADVSIMQKLQQAANINISIKTPCKITLSLESGEKYELTGKPIQSSLTDNTLATSLAVPIESKKVQEHVKEDAPSAALPPKHDTESNETIFTPRKLVIEDLSDRGTFNFIEKTGDNTFTCFVCPEKFLAELDRLEKIYKDASVDASFKPQIGDLVAANSGEDGIVRGVVLNILNNKYECALIDYGTIQWISDVRLLPEKYKSIPEFVCECKADSNVMEDLQNLTNAFMHIKSSCTLTITSPSGKELVVKGFAWNPLKHRNKLLSKSEECVNQKIVNTRKLTIDETSLGGYFEFATRIDEKTFIGCAVPLTFEKYINDLEQINQNCRQDLSFVPKPGDLVAALGLEGFARAVVVDCFNNKFTCAFIDYGIVKNVDEVRYLADKYKMIPQFAFQCTADPVTVDDLESFSCESMSIKAPCMLTVHLTNKKQHTIKGYRWNPTKLHTNNFKQNTCETYKQPPKLLLADSDKVMIVGTYDDFLIVRNKECHSTFKAVCEELISYKGKPYLKPEIGDLAVCNFNDNNLYRVVINKIDGEMVTLNYIDYGNIDSVSISGLQSINEKLATMKCTLIHIHLKDFTRNAFSEDMLKHLMNCSEKREKFQANKVAGEKDVYNLIGTDGISLTERLNKLQKKVTTPKVSTESRTETPQLQEPTVPRTLKSSTPKSSKITEPICRVEDIVKCYVKPGDVKLLCTYVNNLDKGFVSFCNVDDETDMILTYISEKISKCLENDTAGFYIPSVSEVCLAKFDGDWFRAAVIRDDGDNKFGVYFVDYGNHSIVDAKDIRKLPSDLSTTQALAMVCKLDGVIKENEDVVSKALLSRLKVDIVESEIYSSTITSIKDNVYHIVIPNLQQQWKTDGLI